MLNRPVALSLIAFGAAMAVSPAHPQSEDGRDLLQDAVQSLGFTDADRDRVRAGGIVSRERPESDNELAAALAMIIQSPVAAIYRAIERGELFRVDRSTLESHPIDPKSPAASLGALELPEEQQEELRNASAGSALNLSQAEIEQLRKAARSEVLPVYRTLLVQRATAYRDGGMAAIAPYARRDGTGDPGRELEGAVAQLTILPKKAPEFHRAFTEFPVASDGGVEHQFWWQLLDVENKPTPVLTHRLFELGNDYALIAARHFYVARSYNSLQIVVGIFALDPRRSVVIYTNRTFTDQVTGFGGGARHKIGRRMMIDEVETFFGAVRKELEAS